MAWPNVNQGNNQKPIAGLANYRSPDIFPQGGNPQQQTPNLKLTPSNQYGAPPANPPTSLAGTLPKGPIPTVTPGQAPTPIRTVQPNETVQSQLTNLLSTNSPYMRHARLRGFQHANSRGLLNSSLGAQAAEQAAIERGLPVAQQDAETYSQAALANQKTMLDTNLANLQTHTQVGLANLDTQNQRYLAHLDSDTRFGLQKLDNQTKMNLAQLDQDTKLKVEALAGKYRNLLETNKAAADAYRETTNNIATINTTNHLNNEGKANAINYQMRALQHYYDQLEHLAKTDPNNISSLDLSQFFNNVLHGGKRPGGEAPSLPETLGALKRQLPDGVYREVRTQAEQEWTNSTAEFKAKYHNNPFNYIIEKLEEELKKRQ